MNDDILTNIDGEKLQKAAAAVKSTLGNDSGIVDELLSNKEKIAELTSRLSDKEKNMLESLLSNPEMITKMLNTPQGRQALEKFLKK